MTVYPVTGGVLAPDESPLPDVVGSPGTFTITELDPDSGNEASTCTGWLTGAVIPVSGYGGWSRVARPRKVAITEWVGRDSLSLELPFLFDAYADSETTFHGGPGLFVEDQIRVLERLAGVNEDDLQPHLVKIGSEPDKLIPHNRRRSSELRWFIENISWDRDSIIINRHGNTLRAGGTMTLTQYVDGDRLIKSRIVKTKAKRPSRKHAYTVRKGDTLSRIAARKDVYGDASRWRRIATANGIRDPKNLKIGQKLRIP